jgi:hypothetical protein
MTDKATFADWARTYDAVYESPDLIAALACPNCGRRSLRLVLVIRQTGDRRGWAALWCNHCLTGVALDLAEVRPGMRTLVTGDDPAVVSNVIPNYRLIPPSSVPVDQG